MITKRPKSFYYRAFKEDVKTLAHYLWEWLAFSSIEHLIKVFSLNFFQVRFFSMFFRIKMKIWFKFKYILDSVICCKEPRAGINWNAPLLRLHFLQSGSLHLGMFTWRSLLCSHTCEGFMGGVKPLKKTCSELLYGWIEVKRVGSRWSLLSEVHQL